MLLEAPEALVESADSRTRRNAQAQRLIAPPSAGVPPLVSLTWQTAVAPRKTVDNPLSPGDKIERPIHFDHSWINSSQDTMIMSDSSLEPYEIKKLMGKGDWTPVD